MANKRNVMLFGDKMPVMVDGLKDEVNLYLLNDAPDAGALIKQVGSKIGAIILMHHIKVDESFLSQFPNIEQVSSFGVGYDLVDTKYASEHGIIVTNTPDVLNEEVADTAIGLLLCTVREFPQADRYVRAGKWHKAGYPLTKASLQGRIIGMVGMGRIGQAIAKRLEPFGVRIVYHSRNPQSGVDYKHYSRLLDMARDVDTLMVIVPGGASTANIINADVLKALGPQGIVINMSRGSTIDEPALIAALKDRTIYSAGLDVFADEPRVPQELIDMDHIVLLPHVGSGSYPTRARMAQLVVDNVLAWADGKPPPTPVPETPFPPRR